MKTAIYNGKLITPAEVLENKVLVLENDRIIDILAEDVIDLGQYDEKIDAHGRYVCPGFIDTHSDKIEPDHSAASYQRDGFRDGTEGDRAAVDQSGDHNDLPFDITLPG